MFRRHALRLLKEDLRHDCEKLGGVGRAVVAEERDLPVARLILQLCERVTQHARPPLVVPAAREDRGAVRVAVVLVELVRELVDDDVSAVVNGVGAVDDVVPRQDDLPLRPGFAGEDLAMLLQHTGAIRLHAIDDEGAGIDQDLPQVGVIVGAAVEEEEARLRRDGHAHFVVDDEAVAADERLLGQEDLDVLLELELQVGGKQAEIRHAPLQGVAPRVRKRLAAQSGAPAQDEDGLAQQPADDEQRQAEDDEEFHRLAPCFPCSGGT